MGKRINGFFFKPKGVALIGASGNPNKGGFSILTNLIKGFEGPIYPVNPKYDEIQGLRCYRSVSDVPDPVDLAIIFVPAEATLGAARDCAARGIAGVMIQSAGFAESGDRQGRQLQDELKRIRKDSGMRLWGPNCMGLVDAVNEQIFSSDFIEAHQGLQLAELSANTRARLMEIFPEWMPVSNPVDLWPPIERNGPEVAWHKAFKAVCEDPNVDTIFFHVFVGGYSGKLAISPLIEYAKRAGKPVFAWLLSKQSETRNFMIQANQLNVPVFNEIGRAVECMSAVFKRSRYLQRRASLRTQNSR